MAKAEVRLLPANAVLDETGRATSFTTVDGLPANVMVDLATTNDEFPAFVQRQQERFVKVHPGEGRLPPAYQRLEGGTNISQEPLMVYREDAIALASADPQGGGGRVA